MKSGIRYYHGGVPGLSVGDYILPNGETGNWEAHAQLVPHHVQEQVVNMRAEAGYSRHQVYITTDLMVAMAWASMYVTLQKVLGTGTVYEVEPDSPLGPDPDFRLFPDVFLTSPRAKIIHVAHSGVRLEKRRMLMAVGRYLTWEDDTPVYSPDGYMLPSPEDQAKGITTEYLHKLGQWSVVPGQRIM